MVAKGQLDDAISCSLRATELSRNMPKAERDVEGTCGRSGCGRSGSGVFRVVGVEWRCGGFVLAAAENPSGLLPLRMSSNRFDPGLVSNSSGQLRVPLAKRRQSFTSSPLHS
jgi:hypothetical protein